MSETAIGDWVQPKWQGHPFAGQTGQIIEESTNSNGVEFWKIDIDGDCVKDYTINKGDNKVLAGNSTHQGMMGDSFQGLVDQASTVHNIVVPILLAVVALSIFIRFGKRVRGK